MMSDSDLIPEGTEFTSVSAMLSAVQPHLPVYCIYRDVYLAATRSFMDQFPGRVLFAVKANDNLRVLSVLHAAGVSHFDCASLNEIERVQQACPGATCYFMVPVRMRGAARQARERFGVRHFVVDHARGVDILAGEIDFRGTVVFARMAVHHESAMQDLSSKFGAPPADIPELLKRIEQRGAEAALAFNVGSGVTDPMAYQHAMEVAAKVLDKSDVSVRLVDIGGGFPQRYPGYEVPDLAAYFSMIATARALLPIRDKGEVMGEPGRALSAPGMSAVVEILLRKSDRLYINDGMYGIFWELRFKAHDRYPVRAYRNGHELVGETRSFSLYGPTCDSTDVLPGAVVLPAEITEGDYLEFGHIGAYSLAGRTRFNGLYSDQVVYITAAGQTPPAIDHA